MKSPKMDSFLVDFMPAQAVRPTNLKLRSHFGTIFPSSVLFNIQGIQLSPSISSSPTEQPEDNPITGPVTKPPIISASLTPLSLPLQPRGRKYSKLGAPRSVT